MMHAEHTTGTFGEPVCSRLLPATRTVAWDFASVTRRGTHPRRSQDRYFVANLAPAVSVVDTDVDDLRSGDTDRTVALVVAIADGRGAGQDCATDEALAALAEHLRHPLHMGADSEACPPSLRETLPEVRLELDDAFDASQRRLELVAQEPVHDADTATSLTAVYGQWPHLYVAHVGDSRCYLRASGDLRRITRDDTRPLADDEEADGPAAFQHILCNALGSADVVSHRPEVVHRRLAVNDVVLLLSGGLCQCIDEAALEVALDRGTCAAQVARWLIDRFDESGCEDDATLVVARAVSIQPVVVR